jgi:hypothetical protein
MLQLRRLTSGFSPRRPVFDNKPEHVRFAVRKVALVWVFFWEIRFALSQHHFTSAPYPSPSYLMFCWPCIIAYQYSETKVMDFLFSLLRIKGLYMFRALLAHLKEPLHKRHLVYCVRVMSVGCSRIDDAANWHNTHAIYQVPFVQNLFKMSK